MKGQRPEERGGAMSTVGKAMALLDAFDAERGDLGLTELAARTGMDKATTRRLLIQLAESGMIEHDPVTRRYRLGPAVVRLARIRDSHFPFLEIARPFVQALAEETGETTHLSEFESGSLNSIFAAESPRAHRVSVAAGVRLPLHGTAPGLAWLAHAPDAYVDALLARPLSAHTRFTETDPARLRMLIDDTRARGYSIGRQGHEEGVYSTGAAIFGRDPHLAIGAIAIACPLVRIDDAGIPRLGEAVRRAAEAISIKLSGGSPRRTLPAAFSRVSPSPSTLEPAKAGP